MVNDNACYEMVHLDQLLDCGLYQSFPELVHHGKKLIMQITDLRLAFAPWGTFSHNDSTTKRKDLRILMDLGKCFGKQFELPMTLAFFTLRGLPRNWTKTMLPKLALAMLSLHVPPSFLSGDWQEKIVDYEEDRSYEVARFRMVMREFSKYFLQEGESCMML